MYEVTKLSDRTEEGVRKTSFRTCDVIARLEGIDCKGRGTSCSDQLARALKQL